MTDACFPPSLIIRPPSWPVPLLRRLSFPTRYRQAAESGHPRPLIIAVEADLGAPTRVCQRLDHVSHQRAALEWRATIALHQVAQPNLGRKVASDLIWREPREGHYFDIRLHQQRRFRRDTSRQFDVTEVAGGRDAQVIGVALVGDQGAQPAIADQLDSLRRLA